MKRWQRSFAFYFASSVIYMFTVRCSFTSCYNLFKFFKKWNQEHATKIYILKTCTISSGSEDWQTKEKSQRNTRKWFRMSTNRMEDEQWHQGSKSEGLKDSSPSNRLEGRAQGKSSLRHLLGKLLPSPSLHSSCVRRNNNNYPEGLSWG